MYKIALTQVSFDNTYNNVLRFNSRAEQQAYFNVNTLFANVTKEVNYPFGTFYVSRVPIRIDNTEQHEMLSYNYAIVKDCNKENTYFYYFIKNANYDSGNTQIIADLELDIFNTFYLDTEFTPCLVNRAHLDRWGEIVNGKVSFNSNIDSLLFEQERIKTNSKRLVDRQEINVIIDKDNMNVNVYDFLTNHNSGWVYIYFNPSIMSIDLSTLSNDIGYIISKYIDLFNQKVSDNEKVCINTYCVVYPLSKGYYIDLSAWGDSRMNKISWWFGDLNNKAKLGTGGTNVSDDTILAKLAPYILDVQLTSLPPPDVFSRSHNITIENNNLIWHAPSGITNDLTKPFGYSNTNAYNDLQSALCISTSGNVYETTIDLFGVHNTFNVSDIISSQHSMEYNPKLLSQQYCELRLGIGNADAQLYDILKLNIDKDVGLNLEFHHTFTPSIVKQFMGIYNNNSVYQRNNLLTYLGCSHAYDGGLIYSMDMLSQYLAQNKNFYQIRGINTMTKGLTSVLRGASSLAFSSVGLSNLRGRTSNGGGLVSGVGVTELSGIGNAVADYINSDLTLDNMDCSPQQMKNLETAPYLNYGLNKQKPYYEIWKPLECELRIADNDMNMFGYTYNQIDNIKNCDNIRHYWNFVQAQLENITSAMIMSNEVRQHFKAIFSRGVRFWNITDLVTNDTYDYQTHENYERRLANEL